MKETIDTVSSIATQNDRWLFIAMTVLVLVFAWKVITHLVKQNEQSRQAHMALLESMSAKNEATSVTLMKCLDNNSEAWRENTSVLRRCADELRMCERKENKV